MNNYALRADCPHCGVGPWQDCVVKRTGERAVQMHNARWQEWKRRHRSEEMVYQMKEMDSRFRLWRGDLLLCVDYPLDAKVTVLRRLSDGFDPGCNQYLSDVKFVSFWKDLPVSEQVGMMRGAGGRE